MLIGGASPRAAASPSGTSASDEYIVTTTRR